MFYLQKLLIEIKRRKCNLTKQRVKQDFKLKQHIIVPET